MRNSSASRHLHRLLGVLQQSFGALAFVVFPALASAYWEATPGLSLRGLGYLLR